MTPQTPQQIKDLLQQVLNEVNEAIARNIAQSAITGAISGGVGLPPIRRDANGTDHPEDASLAELHAWAPEGVAACDAAMQSGGG